MRPDATLQVKGLGRLMKKVLRDNGDLAFRIQLAKSSLQIDTTPTEQSVMTYAHHLLAEVEQIAHQDKKKKEEKTILGPGPRLKRFEDTRGCISWMTRRDAGRAGLPNVTEHFAPDCDRAKEPSDTQKEKGNSKGRAKTSTRALKKEELVREDAVPGSGTSSDGQPSQQADNVKGFLEEANRMLKGMSLKNHERIG